LAAVVSPWRFQFGQDSQALGDIMKTADPALINVDLIKQLNWRYATKKFDTTKKIDSDTFAILEQAVRLSASSYGLQPWKFVVVTDPAVKKELPAVSYNQPQPADCSHLVVISRVTSLDEAFLDKYVELTAEIRSLSDEKKQAFKGMMAGFIKNTPEAEKAIWSAKQCYIALGFLLGAAAMLGVDAGPMEGFDKEAYDKILDLPAKGCRSVVICALGYRSEGDAYAKVPKVRFPASETVLRI
jgi:nitroreductase